jgi:hypothetical protein
LQARLEIHVLLPSIGAQPKLRRRDVPEEGSVHRIVFSLFFAGKIRANTDALDHQVADFIVLSERFDESNQAAPDFVL